MTALKGRQFWASVDHDDSHDLNQLTVAELLESGKVSIFVAVADVDALVQKGAALDGHAAHRTTSDSTRAANFSMLPEALSFDSFPNENGVLCHSFRAALCWWVQHRSRQDALARLTAKIGHTFWSAPDKRLVRATTYTKGKDAVGSDFQQNESDEKIGLRYATANEAGTLAVPDWLPRGSMVKIHTEQGAFCYIARR